MENSVYRLNLAQQKLSRSCIKGRQSARLLEPVLEFVNLAVFPSDVLLGLLAARQEIFDSEKKISTLKVAYTKFIYKRTEPPPLIELKPTLQSVKTNLPIFKLSVDFPLLFQHFFCFILFVSCLCESVVEIKR